MSAPFTRPANCCRRDPLGEPTLFDLAGLAGVVMAAAQAASDAATDEMDRKLAEAAFGATWGRCAGMHIEAEA